MDLSKLSVKELKEAVAKKEKEEIAALEKRKKEYEKEKQEFINATVTAFADAAARLKELKQHAIIRGNALHTKMYEVYDKEEKEQNSFSLERNDGKYKVVIENQERQSFNEQAEVHINTIKDLLKEKFESRNKGLYGIVNDILMKNNKGDYDEKLVTKLNKHRDTFNDERFTNALDELSKCYQTYDSATYVRVYEKNGLNKWSQINIQFSSL